MSDETQSPRTRLVLHIEVPGIYADDLDAASRMFGEGTADDRLEVVLSEWMQPEVGLTIVTRPDDIDDPQLVAYTCTIVGAEARPASTPSSTEEQ